MSQREHSQHLPQNPQGTNQQRFDQLLHLAQLGDEAAVADLWHEFFFDFSH